MDLNKYFDKIFCINLSSNTHDWQDLQHVFNELNLKVERFEAIDGKTLNSSNYPITSSELGCFKSHLKIIEYAKYNNYKRILIFEDDVEFVNKFNEKIKTYFAQIPDKWSMLYFGANHIKTPTLVSKNILKIQHSYTTHAYAINSEIFNTILNHSELFRYPLDVFYANYIHPNYPCYCFYPHLIYQKDRFSSIQNKYTNYDFIKNYQLPITLNYIFKRPGDAIRRIIKKCISFF